MVKQKVDVLMLPSGEWYGYPQGWMSTAQMMTLMEAVKNGKPPQDVMTQEGEWHTLGWPEGAKEAVFVL